MEESSETTSNDFDDTSLDTESTLAGGEHVEQLREGITADPRSPWSGSAGKAGMKVGLMGNEGTENGAWAAKPRCTPCSGKLNTLVAAGCVLEFAVTTEPNRWGKSALESPIAGLKVTAAVVHVGCQDPKVSDEKFDSDRGSIGCGIMGCPCRGGGGRGPLFRSGPMRFSMVKGCLYVVADVSRDSLSGCK